MRRVKTYLLGRQGCRAAAGKQARGWVRRKTITYACFVRAVALSGVAAPAGKAGSQVSASADQARAALRIGNASGFYGDRFAAMREMLAGGDLDVLTGDYLAELTMLILGRDRLRDPGLGYARTFLRQLEDCLGPALDRGVAIVSNAGGLNPAGLATAVGELAGRLGLAPRIGRDPQTHPGRSRAVFQSAASGESPGRRGH